VKKLYINGCSFTHGHTLPTKKTWPHLLSKKLNVKLFNQARNTNSMGGIVFNTINHLSDFNSNDTLVVIGLTFPNRKHIFFDDYLVNITAGDFNKLDVKSKFKSGKISTPYSLDRNYFDEYEDYENFEPVLKSFLNYLKNYITQCKDISKNYYIEYMTNLISLQSFLKQQKFNYYFVNFNQLIKLDNLLSEWKKSSIFNLLDMDRIIDFDYKKFIDKKTSHPSQYGCEIISEKIYDRIDR
tara:strand:- start:1807 stop:2526 length:720 start_codon:yes stop_codon:yes gene_type:complete